MWGNTREENKEKSEGIYKIKLKSIKHIYVLLLILMNFFQIFCIRLGNLKIYK